MAAEGDEAVYRLTVAGTPQAKEAIQLMKLLQEEFEKRVPLDLSPAEREVRIAALLTEDQRIAEMALHMDRLFKGEESGAGDEDDSV